jgi:hypothetical protein
VRKHAALAIQPKRIGQRDTAQIRRTLPLQESRRVVARHPNDRGL